MHLNIYNSLSSKIAELNTYSFFPSEYEGDITVDPFIKVSVVVSNAGNSDHQGSTYAKGVLIFSVYWKGSSGPTEGLTIIEYLEQNLKNKRLGSLQTFVGSSQFMGTDPKNTALLRRDFTLPFTYHGE